VNWFAFAVVVAILSVARTARLVVFDKYPPMVWLRDRWDYKLKYSGLDTGWGALIHCGFCTGPYLAAGMGVWFLGVQPWQNPADYWSADWWWFAVNGIWGLSYVASIIVAWDQPD
jgi:hypothetical protein